MASKYSKRCFSSVDAVLCLVLAARIHRNDDAVRATAKRLLKVIPKADCPGVRRFITAKAPMETAEKLLNFWFEVHETPGVDTPQA
jgi:hypothetical protein